MTAPPARSNMTRPKPISSALGTATSSASGPVATRAPAAFGCAKRISRSGRARSMFGSEGDRKSDAGDRKSDAGDRKSDAGDRNNDAYGWIDRMAGELLRASRELVESNEASRVSDEAVAQILTAA